MVKKKKKKSYHLQVTSSDSSTERVTSKWQDGHSLRALNVQYFFKVENNKRLDSTNAKESSLDPTETDFNLSWLFFQCQAVSFFHIFYDAFHDVSLQTVIC